MSKIQLILVDEDREKLNWMRKHLKDENYEVFSTTLGEEAYRFLFTNPTIPLLIMSSTLKDIAAVDLLAKIESAIGVPHTIILGKALSARQAVQLMQAGANDIVKSPFHELELKVAVKQAFDTQSLLEQINREKDRNIDNEIGRRLRAFETFVDEKKEKGIPITAGEVMMFFPSIESEQQILGILDAQTFDHYLENCPKPVILTVDDEKGVGKGIARLLAKEFNVIKAHTGQEAYDILKTQHQKIDLVLLDIGMPGRSGDKWVSDFRDLNPELPVAMLTAFKEDIDLIVNTIRAGATDYIAKPYEPIAFREKVSKIVKKKLIKHYLSKWMGTKHYRVVGSSTANSVRHF